MTVGGRWGGEMEEMMWGESTIHSMELQGKLPTETDLHKVYRSLSHSIRFLNPTAGNLW